MIRLSELNLLPGERDLRRRAAKLLHLHEGDILDLKIVRRAVDARKKPQVRLVYTVDVAVKGNEEAILNRCPKAKKAPEDRYCSPAARPAGEKRPVVIGFGPAGMFAGLILALAGQKPIILERGEDARTRHEKVQKFWETGELDPDSNVQFGEGGAGTFSDGKLNTGVNNPRIQWVLEQFVAAGAKEDILYDAKPHVGTDILLTVVQNLRHRIEDLGGEVRFHAQVTGLDRENGALTGLRLSDGSKISCDRAILAIGHSARDTVTMLHELGLPMEPKPFAMGVRIEQNQKVINKAQYGGLDPKLPAADYKLVAHLQDRTVYTFCMCPGGYVVAAASEAGGVVTNGMSYSGRKGGKCQRRIAGESESGGFSRHGSLIRDALAAGNRGKSLCRRRGKLSRPGPESCRFSGPPAQHYPRQRAAHLPSGGHLDGPARSPAQGPDGCAGGGLDGAGKAASRLCSGGCGADGSGIPVLQPRAYFTGRDPAKRPPGPVPGGRGSRVRRGNHVRRRGRHSQRRGPAGKSIKIPPVPTFSERAEKFTAGRNTRPAGRFVKSESPGCPR